MSDRRAFLVAAFGGVLGVLGLRHVPHEEEWEMVNTRSFRQFEYRPRWDGLVPPGTKAVFQASDDYIPVTLSSRRAYGTLGTMKRGDTFTIAGHYTPSGKLREFITE